MSFINQVDGNGNFKVTNVNSDNVTATTGNFTYLNTTTFSPSNVNTNALVASNVVSTTGTIDTFNTTTITSSSQINTSDLNVTNKITTNEADILLQKVGELRVENQAGKYMSLDHDATDANFYGAKNNNSSPSSFNFYTADGTQNDLNLKINANTDTVEVQNLISTVGISTTGLTSTNMTSRNLNLMNNNQHYTTIERDAHLVKFIGDSSSSGNKVGYEFFTGNASQSGGNVPALSILKDTDAVEVINLNVTNTIEGVNVIAQEVESNDITAKGNLYVENSTGKKCSIEHIADNINIYGAKNNNSSPSNINFFTNAGANASDNKLKIYKDSDIVEVINLNATDTVDTTTVVADQVSCVDIGCQNITTGDITVNDEIDFGPSKSKIWSAGSFLFQSGETLFGKDFKFQTGNINEVVYFKAGQGKGVIQTDDINANTVNTDQLNIDQVFSMTNVNYPSSNLIQYYNGSSTSTDFPLLDVVYPAFTNVSPYFNNYNILNMMGFTNNQSRANRSIEVICPFNINSDLIVNGNNIETSKQDTLIPGTGITIVGNTISSTGGASYTAGTNININSNNEIETITNPVFDSLEAGDTLIGDSGTSARFSHKNLTSINDWALTQYSTGETHLNSSSNQELQFRQGGTTKAKLDNAGNFHFTRNGTLEQLDTTLDTMDATIATKQPLLSAGTGITIDANNEISSSAVTYTAGANMIINAQDEIQTVLDPDFDQVDAGNTSIGGGGSAAVFHHKNLTNGFADWAITHYSNGKLILNSKSSQEILFRQNQVTKARVDTAGDFHIMRVGTLSNLPQELDQIQGDLVGKQVNLTAGANIALDSLGNISSTDTTYTAGTNITIDANNVISSTGGGGGSNQLSRTSYYTGGANTVPNGILNYYYNVSTAVINNLNIPFTNQANNASSGWFLEPGTYKIEYKCNFDNGVYGNRLGIRALIQFNNVDYLPSECYGYARDQNFIDKQTVSTEIIYTVPLGGQYMAIKHNCSQNSSNYTSPFPSTGVNVPGGLSLIITRLDQVDGIANVNVTKPMFHVTNQTNGNVTYGGGAQTILPFNDQAPAGCFEVGNGYNYSTYKYTIPKSGIWRFNVHLFINTTTADTNARIALYKNNLAFAYGGNRAGYSEDLHLLNKFDVGDVIDVRVNSMIIYLGAGHTYWSGEWVSDSNGNL